MSYSITLAACALASLSMLIVMPASVNAAENQVAAAEERIIRVTNDFRGEQGLPVLSTNESLIKAATDFANFMLTESKYGHYADGRRPSERAEAAGYDYCVVRENIAYRVDPSQPDPSEIGQHFVDGWKESEEHRDNMLGAHITETGVAVVTADGKTFYAVQMFGRPISARFKLQIKNDTDTTQTLLFRSEDSRDEIAVPPSTMLSVSRCVETTVSLESNDGQPSKDEEATDTRITVKEAGEFVITFDEDHNAVLRSL